MQHLFAVNGTSLLPSSLLFIGKMEWGLVIMKKNMADTLPSSISFHSVVVITFA